MFPQLTEEQQVRVAEEILAFTSRRVRARAEDEEAILTPSNRTA
jgi:hypothetical protein